MRALIFDMDGLMFDTSAVFAKAWDYAGEKMGIGKAGYMIARAQGMSISNSKELWTEEFGSKYAEGALRALTKEFLLSYYRENAAPMKPGLLELLEHAKGLNKKLAVASSAPEWEVEKHLKDAGLTAYFSVIVNGSMAAASKPAPDIYIKACALLDEKPSGCMALEDSKTGVLSAYDAGCRVVMVPDIGEPDEETKGKAYRIAKDLSEVMGLIAR